MNHVVAGDQSSVVYQRAVTEAMNASSSAIASLRAALKGRVIAPDDSEFDHARTVFIGGIDRRPAAIARVADATDVAQVVTFAQERGLELAVRSGGHSSAGHGVSDGGIVIDLREMRALQIDSERRTAWVETGLNTGEYINAAAAYGLATGFGDTGSVGIGGITLGGGLGYLVRKHGLTVDDLLAAEIVTADGHLRRVDSETFPDLFWAIRGGGGNFGIATRFQFWLHPVDTVVGGLMILPATPEIITDFIAAADAAPEELSTIATVMKAPPMPAIPAEMHGRLVLMAMLVYAGDVAAGQRAVAPFRALATPIADMVRTMPFPAIFPPEQPGFHPVTSGQTMFLDDIDRGVAESILDHLQDSTAQLAAVQIRVLGGAMARVPADATAFAHRDARLMVSVNAVYGRTDEAAQNESWVREVTMALTQDGEAPDRAYVNFLASEGGARIRAAYPGTSWDRLAAIKRRYDPTNLFCLNQNIPPAA